MKIQKLAKGFDCTSVPNNCDTDLYCTPAILGDRHCCSPGQKWVVDIDLSAGGYCTESQGCTSEAKRGTRLGNCISAIASTLKGKGFAYLAEQCISSGKVCCQVNLGGELSTEWVDKNDCIIPY